MKKTAKVLQAIAFIESLGLTMEEYHRLASELEDLDYADDEEDDTQDAYDSSYARIEEENCKSL